MKTPQTILFKSSTNPIKSENIKEMLTPYYSQGYKLNSLTSGFNNGMYNTTLTVR